MRGPALCDVDEVMHVTASIKHLDSRSFGNGIVFITREFTREAIDEVYSKDAMKLISVRILLGEWNVRLIFICNTPQSNLLIYSPARFMPLGALLKQNAMSPLELTQLKRHSMPSDSGFCKPLSIVISSEHIASIH